MCTLTWQASQDGIDLFFNRDEARGRSRALPPKTYQLDQTQVLMPIDPDGMGTWIAANEFGVIVCLLNDYQHAQTVAPRLSRGQLVKALAVCTDLNDIANALPIDALRDFAPFLLLGFAVDGLSDKTHGSEVVPRAWRWNGQTLRCVDCQPPVVSSAIDIDTTTNTRTHYLRQMGGTVPTQQQLLAYHRSHLPERGSASVCMHREDASTVSLTHVHIGADGITMYYYDGAPCLVETPQAAYLPLARNYDLKANTGTDGH
jgi:hypothetical protein